MTGFGPQKWQQHWHIIYYFKALSLNITNLLITFKWKYATCHSFCGNRSHLVLAIDDLHISHNASGMEANICVLLIRNANSHSSLVVNGLELPCLVATLCLYETMVAKVVCSYAVDAKRNWSKTWTDSLLCDRKFYRFLTFLARGHRPKYFLKVCS